MIVTSEVDDIRGDRHHKSRGQSTPKGGEAFITSDFLEAVKRGSDVLTARLVDCAICCC